MIAILLAACLHAPPMTWTDAIPVATPPPPREYPRREGDCPDARAVVPGHVSDCRGVLLPLAMLDELEDGDDRAAYWRRVYEASQAAREADRAHAQSVVEHWHGEAIRARREASATRAGALGAGALIVLGVVLAVLP